MNLNGKVVLVTGGASGIGLACVREFLAHGIKGASIVDIDEDNGKKIAEELQNQYGDNKVIFLRGDVSNITDFRSAFQKTVETFGNLDILLNNAGISNEFEPIKCYAVNMVGVTSGLQLAMDEFLPKYKSSGSDGVIVNVSSIAGLYLKRNYTVPIYAASKCAILGLTVAYGNDFHYSRTGVKVIAICPGKTITPLQAQNANRIRYIKEFIKEEEHLPSQEANILAKNLLIVLERAKNGSVWKMEGGQIEKIDSIPLI